MSSTPKGQGPVPMNVMNIPQSFGPNEAQAIVTYLQKRVRVENLDEAQALTTLVASFVAFMNKYFDSQQAQAAQAAQQALPFPPSLATVLPPAPAKNYEKDE